MFQSGAGIFSLRGEVENMSSNPASALLQSVKKPTRGS